MRKTTTVESREFCYSLGHVPETAITTTGKRLVVSERFARWMVYFPEHTGFLGIDYLDGKSVYRVVDYHTALKFEKLVHAVSRIKAVKRLTKTTASALSGCEYQIVEISALKRHGRILRTRTL